jgi:hypothetical protein
MLQNINLKIPVKLKCFFCKDFQALSFIFIKKITYKLTDHEFYHIFIPLWLFIENNEPIKFTVCVEFSLSKLK